MAQEERIKKIITRLKNEICESCFQCSGDTRITKIEKKDGDSHWNNFGDVIEFQIECDICKASKTCQCDLQSEIDNQARLDGETLFNHALLKDLDGKINSVDGKIFSFERYKNAELICMRLRKEYDEGLSQWKDFEKARDDIFLNIMPEGLYNMEKINKVLSGSN